ncbi:hypothetical protein B0H17DRAFT_1199221 [Mycena rosella]|uniref:Uncharacterized protein n=1 Tax=Mycena rosella TaxID=1033263 RepID=A0AAD7GM73_MYCRO|nr:hypothetical protein B0H17DRAFT_1199221 [Mycena rosella]
MSEIPKRQMRSTKTALLHDLLPPTKLKPRSRKPAAASKSKVAEPLPETEAPAVHSAEGPAAAASAASSSSGDLATDPFNLAQRGRAAGLAPPAGASAPALSRMATVMLDDWEDDIIEIASFDGRPKTLSFNFKDRSSGGYVEIDDLAPVKTEEVEPVMDQGMSYNQSPTPHYTRGRSHSSARGGAGSARGRSHEESASPQQSPRRRSYSLSDVGAGPLAPARGRSRDRASQPHEVPPRIFCLTGSWTQPPAAFESARSSAQALSFTRILHLTGSRSHSYDSVLHSPRLPPCRNTPLPPSSPPPPSSQQPHEADDSSSESSSELSSKSSFEAESNDYEKFQNIERKQKEKAAARLGREVERARSEIEDSEDEQDFEREVMKNGYEDDDGARRQGKPAEKKKRAQRGDAGMRPTNARGKNKVKAKAKGKGKAKAKARVVEQDNDAEDLDGNNEDEDEDEDDDEGAGANHKSGPIPKAIHEAMVAAHDVFLAEIVALAKQCGKAPHTLHRSLGTVVKGSRGTAPWNIWQTWYLVEHPIDKEKEDTGAYNTKSR